MHGAGLANLVFATPGAKVLELVSPLHGNLAFHALAANCELRHDTFHLDVADGADRGDTRFANVVVEPEGFLRKLKAFAS